MANIKFNYSNNSFTSNWSFDKNIEKVVALAILMPIVASMGGNAATNSNCNSKTFGNERINRFKYKKIISKDF